MKRLLRSGILSSGLLVLSASAQTELITLEPDNYAPGTVLNHVVPQVSLITAADNNLPHPPAPFDITAQTDVFPFAPPTGALVFSHVGVPFFYTDRRLRMDFAGVTTSVSIDFQAHVNAERGKLDVFGLNGSLLGTYLTDPLNAGVTETLTITHPAADIAWAVAYTAPGSGSFGRLDHLVFGAPVAVPEPHSVALLAVGLLILTGKISLRSRR
jgi:hypothetical protein